jgi:hypothetical protein
MLTALVVAGSLAAASAALSVNESRSFEVMVGYLK